MQKESIITEKHCRLIESFLHLKVMTNRLIIKTILVKIYKVKILEHIN